MTKGTLERSKGSKGGRASRRRKARRRKRPSAFAAVIVVIVVLGGAATLLTRQQRSDVTLEVGPVSVRGSTLPSMPTSGSPDRAIGMRAPELTGRDFDGRRVQVVHDGTPTVVVYLAHWCPHCQQDVRDVTAWVERVGLPSGVRIVSVSTLVDPDKPPYPPSEWLGDAGWPFPVLMDDEDSPAADAYGLVGTPLWVFLDGEGTVQGRVDGEIGIERLEQALSALRAGA